MSQVINPERSRTSIPLSTTLNANRMGREVKDPVEDPEQSRRERSRTSIPLSTTLSANRMGRRIRVRYAPSPTGIPHIGNIRTALFNYLFAKNHNGDFLLRIEDTDQKRLVPGSLEKIKESLERLNLKWDEYYVQSERIETYQKYLNELKDKGVVYEDEGAWRFKVEKGKKLQWDDGVHGTIQFASDVIEDFIIIKSDKFPTYHFANVIDDTEMKISHVLRGDEWLSSTPKHLMLYEAFGWQPPVFSHMPIILGADRKKLSKREGAKSVMEYIDEGYLPEAIINFLAFLGWSPKDNQEIFSLVELTREFSLDRINKNSPIFSPEKLDWFNGQWIRKIDDARLTELVQKKFSRYDEDQIKKVLQRVKDRMRTLNDFIKLAGFILEEKIDSGYANSPNLLVPIKKEYQSIPDGQWKSSFISLATTSVIEQNQLDPRETKSNIGTAVSGSTVTPPLFDSLEDLGKTKTIERLEDAIKKTQK